MPGVTASGYFTFQEVSFVSTGVVTPDLNHNRILWAGNLAPGQAAGVPFIAYKADMPSLARIDLDVDDPGVLRDVDRLEDLPK